MNKQEYTTLYLVRHGETEHNLEDIISGQPTDSPLTANGIQQAKARALDLVGINFDAVFSSDLGRAKQTAEILLLERELAIITKELLRERHFGRWEGKKADEYRAHSKESLEKFETLTEEQKWPYKIDPTMESNEEVCARMITALREISVAYAGKTVLVVAHGSIIRAFLIKLGYGTHSELRGAAVSNTAYIKLRSDGIDFFIDETKGINKT